MSRDVKTLLPVLPVLLEAFACVKTGTEVLNYRDHTLSLDGDQFSVRVPEGYTLELLARALDEPRMLTFAEKERQVSNFKSLGLRPILGA